MKKLKIFLMTIMFTLAPLIAQAHGYFDPRDLPWYWKIIVYPAIYIWAGIEKIKDVFSGG